MSKEQSTTDTTNEHEGFPSRMEKAKQNTRSNTYGPNYSEYKAMATNDTLAMVELFLLNIPLQMGYSPKQWRKALDVMLKKKVNKQDVKTLRTIGLQEVVLNFLCKYLGRWAMEKATQYKQLAQEQYGSWKHHTAISQALNKQLTMDIAMLQKISMVFCSQDAESCYNRISHAALVMELCQQNVAGTAI